MYVQGSIRLMVGGLAECAIYFRTNRVVFIAEWREPPGLIRTLYSPQPDGSRRAATKVDDIGIADCGTDVVDRSCDRTTANSLAL